MNFVEKRRYRRDIDGLRAIAVVAVIIFHFGGLPNGYLGVDIFFVISGYLITDIINRELNENRFSIVNFYIRRTRRILPLTLFIVFVSLSIGVFVMLPDDLENLAQSVVATNLFSNNILQSITTKNYWDVVNEYKPLMHTWSLGVEEQYYIIYPLLLLLIGRHHKKLLLPTLIILTIVSFFLYFLSFEKYVIFYHLPFRFFELALGGIAALYLKNKVIVHNYSAFFVIGLILILCLNLNFLPSQYTLLITVMLTLGIIVTANDKNKISSFILQNKASVSIGLISFSLYMWHQVILSYARYFVVKELEILHLSVIFFLTVLLSWITYYLIENPFRNKNIIRTGFLFSVVGILFTITTLPSLYIYWKGGVIRDIPELGIIETNAMRNVHANYNHRIYEYDKPFSDRQNKIKVLIIGNSFARDWANVLLQSKYNGDIDLSYVYNPINQPDFKTRIESSDIIFYSTASRQLVKTLDINESKLFVVGTKNFGKNSGYFYNYSGSDYFAQRTFMEDGYLKDNDKLKREWGDRYFDLIGKIIDGNNTVPVFTPNNMFISQDCRHFTKAGAQYFASLFENELSSIFDKIRDKNKQHNTYSSKKGAE